MAKGINSCPRSCSGVFAVRMRVVGMRVDISDGVVGVVESEERE
jgi:hypothetical protein